MQSGCPHGAEPAGRHRSATPAHAPKIGGAGPTPLGGPSRRTATAARARALSIGIARSRVEKEWAALMGKGVCVARYRAAMDDMRFIMTANDVPPKHSRPSGSQVKTDVHEHSLYSTGWCPQRVEGPPWCIETNHDSVAG